MAKELPYFKFEPNAWENGTIQILSREDKGLFIDLCSMYWSRLGELSYKLALHKLCNGNANALQTLIDENIIFVEGEKICISFLDEQLSEFNTISDERSKAAKKRWSKPTENKVVNANALQMESKSNAIREEEIRGEEKREDEIRENYPLPSGAIPDKPTLEDFALEFAVKKYNAKFVRDAFNYYHNDGSWTDAQGNAVHKFNFKQKLSNIVKSKGWDGEEKEKVKVKMNVRD
jgi:hypothetical protein